jgi:hypothetical protein
MEQEQPAGIGPVERGVRPAVAEARRLAHAYADAKLMRYGLLNIANPPDPQAAFDALEAAIDAAVADERERLLEELRTMHAQQKGRHNYYLYAAELLAGNL